MVTRRARSTGRSLSRSPSRPARYGSGSHQLRLSSKRGPPPLLQRGPERRRWRRSSVLTQQSERRGARHSCAITKRFDALKLPMGSVSLSQHRGEPIRAHPCTPEQLNDAMATGAVKEEVECKGREEERYQSHAEASRRRRYSVAEEVSKTDPPSGPHHRARE